VKDASLTNSMSWEKLDLLLPQLSRNDIEADDILDLCEDASDTWSSSYESPRRLTGMIKLSRCRLLVLADCACGRWKTTMPVCHSS